MVIEVLLQIRERSLNLVIGIWHAFTFRVLIRKQVRQIKVNTIY